MPACAKEAANSRHAASARPSPAAPRFGARRGRPRRAGMAASPAPLSRDPRAPPRPAPSRGAARPAPPVRAMLLLVLLCARLCAAALSGRGEFRLAGLFQIHGLRPGRPLARGCCV